MSKTSILVIRFYSTCCFKNVNHFFYITDTDDLEYIHGNYMVSNVRYNNI